MARLLLILIGIPVILIIAAAILLPLLVDKQQVVDAASKQLQEQTGAALDVDGDIGLSVFPTLRVTLTDTTLRMPEEQGAEITVQSLDIGVRPLPLLSGKLEIDSISLDGLLARLTSGSGKGEQPAIDTSTMSDEELEALYAARRQALAEAGEAAQGQQVLAAPLALEVGKLSITNSRLELKNPASGEVTAVNLEKVLAQNLNLDGRPIPLELRLQLEGQRPIDLGFDGSIIVAQSVQTVTLQSADLEIAGAMAEPLSLQVTGPVDVANQVADLQVVILQADTRGEGALRYASFESPQITATLRLNQFNPALVALVGPEAAGADAEETRVEEAAPDTGDDALPLAALRGIDSRANLIIDKAVFDAHTIENLQLNLRAVEGDITVTKLQGKLHGGMLDMKARLNARHNTARLSVNGGLEGLDIATALAAVESEPVMTGTANLNLTLNSAGRTRNELIRALSGPINLTTEQVVARDAKLEKMFCKAVALANQQRLTAQFPRDTALKDLSADIQLADGKAVMKPLRIELKGASLHGKGNLDLLSQDFKADFDARITPELSRLDPACEVNERYLAIDWPVACRGNVSDDDPGEWCSVDSGDILEQLAKKEASRKVKKEAGRLMEKLLNK